MHSTSDYLVRMLRDEGLLDAAGLDRATALAVERGIPVEDALIAAGLVTPRDLAVSKAVLCEAAFVDPTNYEIDILNARLLPRGIAEKHQAFPLFVLDGVATIGMADPLNLGAIDQIRQLLKMEIEAVLCVPEQISALTAKAYSLVTGGAGDADREWDEGSVEAGREMTTGDEPIVAAVNQIIAEAIELRASDIHISPCETELQLRYRVDGELQAKQGPPLSAHSAIVQRLKVMANLDLTQTRRPQDGKFRFTHRSEHFEVRLSTMPTVCGENVVMRVLRPHAQILDFPELGVPGEMCEELDRLIAHPHGMLLVTGPTGSGKTSTLYTAIKKLNGPNVNIMTIEDPVEIRMHGVRQIQAHPEIGLTFAGALRSILRQDPDVVLVGEIRDLETAMIAMQASLTGHLVLSTLHTNDAAGAVARLKDLGVPAFVINSALLGVIAQRLVRRVCRDCAAPAAADPALLRRFGLTEARNAKLTEGKGCARCGGSGFRGRIGIYELLRLTPELGAEIERGATTHQINRFAIEAGMKPMWRDGLEKACAGITTLNEVAQAVVALEIEADAGMLRLSA